MIFQYIGLASKQWLCKYNCVLNVKPFTLILCNTYLVSTKQAIKTVVAIFNIGFIVQLFHVMDLYSYVQNSMISCPKLYLVKLLHSKPAFKNYHSLSPQKKSFRLKKAHLQFNEQFEECTGKIGYIWFNKLYKDQFNLFKVTWSTSVYMLPVGMIFVQTFKIINDPFSLLRVTKGQNNFPQQDKSRCEMVNRDICQSQLSSAQHIRLANSGIHQVRKKYYNKNAVTFTFSAYHFWRFRFSCTKTF